MRSRAFPLLAVCAALAASPGPALAGPWVSPSALAHFMRARLAETAGDLATARREVGLAILFDEDAGALRLLHAALLLRSGEPARAEAEARRALEGEPDPDTAARARFLLGRAAADAGRPDVAARELAKAARLEPLAARSSGRDLNADPWRALAAVRSVAGDEAGAARALDDLATRLPGDAAEGWLAFAQAALERGDAALAGRHLARAAALAPSDPRAHRALAALAERDGRAADARAAWEAAVRADPDDPGALFALGYAHERAGDLAAGLSVMQGLLAVEPDHAGALNFVAYGLAERGERLEEAERMIRRALELEPENTSFLDSLGWVHFQRGDYPRAVEALERAARAGGEEPTVLEHLGDAYRRAGRRDEAAAAYRRALALLAGVAPDAAAAEAARRGAQRAALERKVLELFSLR